ncbi:BhlA/UviB family holin-like peptide [Paraclostridium bifermentans]|uniref:BhlA/UviB family holin-like peptide n=1 Tax=Paraclostridium bifermentans TaxID=1490 RepID=UPI001C7F5F22|nr:BhlA/UviB family holin-like peptide [Paraclostridium bifermentans]GIM32237.1 bacteriocin UviB [Paraclostridium bifermentans subsp. muricolitidis]
MNQDIINLFISQGVFAVLFCYLLLYVLKENSSREQNYQNIIKDLTECLPDIKEDIAVIKKDVFRTTTTTL